MQYLIADLPKYIRTDSKNLAKNQWKFCWLCTQIAKGAWNKKYHTSKLTTLAVSCWSCSPWRKVGLWFPEVDEGEGRLSHHNILESHSSAFENKNKPIDLLHKLTYISGRS